LQGQLRPPKTLLGIPALDRLVGMVLGPQDGSPAAGPVVEITSTSTAAGKTHVLYYIAALSTLPAQHAGVSLHGKSAAIVVFDTDGRFDVHRLRLIMNSHILACFSAAAAASSLPSTEELDTLTTAALEHIHIFRPQSSREMMEILKTLPAYLFDFSCHHSAHRRLDALLVDGISAFYWQDRLDAAAYPELYQLLVYHLRTVAVRFGAFVVATNWGLHLSDTASEAGPGSPGKVAFRSHLPPAWGKFVDVKLVVERGGPGEFRGWIDTRGLGVRAQGTLKSENVTFRFRIGYEGIVFEE
jgi:hypothetical protein